jgi:glycosyltransferase involved in cell wall biosynthesis
MMVDHLERMGHRVDIISLPEKPYVPNLTDNLLSKWPQILQERRPDILLQDELSHPSLFLLNEKIKKVLGCPIITIVHHLRSSEVRPAWQNVFYRGVEKRYLKTIDGFIFNSETTRLVIANLLGEERPNVVAYPGGDHIVSDIASGMILDRACKPGPLKLLFIGNVIARKGLHILIDALSRLTDQNWQLTIAGSLSADRRYAGRVKRLITDAGLGQRVALMGGVDQETLMQLLENHHCLAAPSSYEGFGIVYLEAMAFGLPVIASTEGAIPEVVADGREGFLVPVGDSVTLANRIGILIHDRHHLARLGLAARSRYLKHPSWADSAGRIHNFFHKIVGSLKGRAPG